jgi:hypothetical protein
LHGENHHESHFFRSLLEKKLTTEELRGRAQGFEQLRRFIEKAAAAGGVSASSRVVKKSFPYPFQVIRVDLDVLKGEACVPDDKPVG